MIDQIRISLLHLQLYEKGCHTKTSKHTMIGSGCELPQFLFVTSFPPNSLLIIISGGDNISQIYMYKKTYLCVCLHELAISEDER